MNESSERNVVSVEITDAFLNSSLEISLGRGERRQRMQQRFSLVFFIAIVIRYPDYLIDVIFHPSIDDAALLEELGGMFCRVGKFYLSSDDRLY
jgi:hypothetical protein